MDFCGGLVGRGRHGHAPAVELLLSHMRSLSPKRDASYPLAAVDGSSRSVLMLAAQDGYEDRVALPAPVSDLRAVNNQGLCARDMALERGSRAAAGGGVALLVAPASRVGPLACGS